MYVRITERKLEDWRKVWPCSTLVTGWFEMENGDLVDLGGKLATADVDGVELMAFQAWA